MFSQLIYASRMASGVKIDDLKKILDAARAGNARNGVTGVLCFGESSFLQCLEGPRDKVTTTFTTIARDPRHEAVELLGVTDADVRFFDGWSMGWTRTRAGEPIIRKYFTDGLFLASSLRGPAALAFLREVATRSTTACRDVPVMDETVALERF